MKLKRKPASWRLDYLAKHPPRGDHKLIFLQIEQWKKLQAMWRSNKLDPHEYLTLDQLIHSNVDGLELAAAFLNIKRRGLKN